MDQDVVDRKDPPRVRERPAPTAYSIAIFAVVAVLLFAGMYFLVPENYRSTATTTSPTVAEKAAPAPAPPATTGQGGTAK